MVLRSVAVFCGALPGARPEYAAAARSLGKALAHRGIRLVYGGGRAGLMGEVADAVLGEAGAVTGVIPGFMEEREVAHRGVTELVITVSMHERKARMADMADAFVVLPGGFGTLDEMFEILTWSQLGLHDKPLALFNVAGYFDPLMTFIRHGRTEGFVRPGNLDDLFLADAVDELLEHLAARHSRVPGTLSLS